MADKTFPMTNKSEHCRRYKMSNPSQMINKHPQLDNLPPELRKHLKKFYDAGYIPDDILSEIKTSLLDAINNQELLSGYSLIYPNRISYDINELIVWLSVSFPVCIKKEPDPIFKPEKTSEQICLVCFDEYKRYDFIWENDIEDKIKAHKDIIDITIITDFEDMHTLVKSFKKTMQHEFGNLPKLGVKKDSGSCFLLDKEIWRPEYNRIKDKQLISLKDCICILLGIDDLSLIVSIDNHLDYITEEQGRYLWEDDFYILPFVPADNSFRDVIVTAKYREGWRDVISFIKDFIEKIIRASETGIIDLVSYSTLMGNHFHLRDIKTHRYYFKTLPFLKWAKEAGYEIPLELDFVENADGTLQWSDSYTRHNIKSDKIDNSSEMSTKEKLYQNLKNFYPEVNLLYSGLINLLKSNTNKTVANADKEELKKSALTFYSQNQSLFKSLKREHIEPDSIYDIVGKQKKATAGKILKIIINTELPYILVDPKIKTDANSLYELANKLRPKTA